MDTNETYLKKNGNKKGWKKKKKEGVGGGRGSREVTDLNGSRKF